MAQLEYGDFYKFTASAGITLIVGAVAVPWLFLREPFDLALDASKLALLTPEAQSVIHTRQCLVSAAIHYLPYASGLMAATGIALAVFGLLSWRSRQAVRDESEDLQNKKLDKELQAMSPGEIETSAKSEPEISDDAEPGLLPSLQASATVTSVLAVEQALLSQISSCLGPSMPVLTNKRLQNVEFDAIVKAGKAGDLIVEIKYIRRGFSDGWVRETMNSLSLKMAVYSKKSSTNVGGLLLVVFAASNSPLSQKIVSISRELLDAHPSRFDKIRVQTLDETDIATIACWDLKRIVLG